jgi:hypothetical protein
MYPGDPNQQSKTHFFGERFPSNGQPMAESDSESEPDRNESRKPILN